MNNSEVARIIDGARSGVGFRGHAGIQLCGDWCRHFEPLDAPWDGFGRCVHPLSLRHGQVFSVFHECTVGEVAPPESSEDQRK